MITRVFILISLFLLVLLPASSFLFTKLAVIFLSIFSFLFHVFYIKKIRNSSFKFFVFYLLWVVVLFLWLIYSICYDAENLYNHLRAFAGYVGCLTYFVFLVFAIRERVISIEDFFYVIVLGLFLYGSIKLCIIFAPVVVVVSVSELKDILFAYIGSITYEYWREDASIARISFGNDILVPFIIALLLANEQVSRVFNKYYLYAFYCLSLMCGIFSFTRYIWLLYIIIMFVYFVLIRKMYIAGLVFSLFFGVIILFLLQMPWLNEIISIRGGDVSSLDMKSLQTIELLSYWLKNAFWGNGIGSYVPTLIRSEYQTYIYEVQWAALLMQFGLLGISFIILCLGGILVVIFHSNLKNKKYLAFFYILWLLSGFTNPYLFILSSSVVYISFWISSDAKCWGRM